MGLQSQHRTRQEPQATCSVPCSPDKAQYLAQIAKLSTESLRILAEKSRKPGIESKLKTFEHFI